MQIVSPKLAAHDLHIWVIRNDFFAAPELAASLSDDERRRADCFRSQKLTERYVVSHASVRYALSNYLRVPPSDINIAIDSMARPYLPDHPNFDFNLSHTDGISVVAVRRGTVGVDVERLRDDIDAKAIARRVLSARERATIIDGVAASRTPFFDYWTLKEAYAKAIGLGVRVQFSNIDVSLYDPMTVATHGVYDDGRNWVFELYGCREFRLAVAARQPHAGDIEIRLIEVDNKFEPQGLLPMELLRSTKSLPSWQASSGEQSRLRSIRRV